MRPPGGKPCESEGPLAPHDSVSVTQGWEEGVLMVESLEARRVHLWVDALSTVPDGGDTATAALHATIVFHSPRNQSATQDARSQPSLCLEKILPGSGYDCALCEHTCLQISFTLQRNGTLLLLGKSLSFPAGRDQNVFPFFSRGISASTGLFGNGTAMQFLVNPPSIQRFYASATSSVAHVSVNSLPWESAGYLNEWLSLDDTLLQPAPGLDFPTDIEMHVVRGQQEDQGVAVAVQQHPASLNRYQGLVAFSGAEGSNVSFTLVFRSEDGAIQCCRRGIEYAVGVNPKPQTRNPKPESRNPKP